jgi:hypothetical protein
VGGARFQLLGSRGMPLLNDLQDLTKTLLSFLSLNNTLTNLLQIESAQFIPRGKFTGVKLPHALRLDLQNAVRKSKREQESRLTTITSSP